MNLSFLLLLFLFNIYPQISAVNPSFTTCKKSIQCGSLKNITYPFYDGKTRPEYCGYPGLKLDCVNSSPQMNISNQIYNLLNIVNNSTIRVSMKSFNSTTACLDRLLNTTFNSSIFNFPSVDQNLTFFYDCHYPNLLPTFMLKRECELLGSALLTGYYATPSMLQMYNGFGNCKSVVVPILQSAAKLIDTSRSLEYLLKAFEEGFDLGFNAASTGFSCGFCVGSGGACGFNLTTHKFVCYCPDADYNLNCSVGVTTPTSPGHHDTTPPAVVSSRNHKITPLIVGASIGGLLLVALILGSCFLLLHHKRRQLRFAQQKATPNPIPSSSSFGNNRFTAVQARGSSAYTNTTSSTNNSHSASSYASSRHEDETPNTYFGVPIFDYSVLQQATKDFDDSRELGSGGYGRVYYGQLPDGRQVAVKRLYEKSFRRMEQFMNEIEIFAKLKHKNLVTLYGCTSTRSRLLVLVYEYICNGTVADHLHGKHAQTAFLEWPIRLSIALETAEALAYLHKSDVIHRDVKTTNILLDKGFHVKVADFGLSRLFPDDATHLSTFPQGTPGYVDPEYYNCFRLTEKSDVYSFGVILIELISSMQAVDGARNTNHVNLANMALDRIQNQALHELVDPRLGFERDHEVQRMVKMVAELGFRCLQQDKDMRPTMEEAVAMLRGIQMLEARSSKMEGIVVVKCGDEVGLLKSVGT